MTRNTRAVLLTLFSISVAGSSIAAEKQAPRPAAASATGRSAKPESATRVEGTTGYRLANGLARLPFPHAPPLPPLRTHPSSAGARGRARPALCLPGCGR